MDIENGRASLFHGVYVWTCDAGTGNYAKGGDGANYSLMGQEV